MLRAVLLIGVVAIILATGPSAFATRYMDESDWTRLRTAQDGIVAFDEAALYPLLECAESLGDWENVAYIPQPDYQNIRHEPARYRGLMFGIEGKLAAPPRMVGRLSRSGPWDEKLQQWIIKVGPEESDVAVLYLTDPPNHLSRPRVGEPVRSLACFYKIWQQPRSEDGEPAMFLTFVGRTIELDRSAMPPQESRVVQGWFFWAITASLVSLAIIWNIARWFARQKTLEAQAMRLAAASRQSSLCEETPSSPHAISHEPPLPDDPVEAMREMDRRRKDSE